jgi:hypothetical protein
MQGPKSLKVSHEDLFKLQPYLSGHYYAMGKRKSTAGEDKTPSKDKMDVDGEDSGSDDYVRWSASSPCEYER